MYENRTKKVNKTELGKIILCIYHQGMYIIARWRASRDWIIRATPRWSRFRHSPTHYFFSPYRSGDDDDDFHRNRIFLGGRSLYGTWKGFVSSVEMMSTIFEKRMNFRVPGGMGGGKFRLFLSSASFFFVQACRGVQKRNFKTGLWHTFGGVKAAWPRLWNFIWITLASSLALSRSLFELSENFPTGIKLLEIVFHRLRPPTEFSKFTLVRCKKSKKQAENYLRWYFFF